MPRPPCTILLIQRERIVRLDLAKQKQGWKTLHTQEMDRQDPEDLPYLVESILQEGAKPARGVWVLSSEIWTQILGLPASKLANLHGNDLNAALAFEAETLSGVAGYDSALAFQEMPREGRLRRFWVLHQSATERDTLATAIQKAGCKMLGIMQAAGLPRNLAPVQTVSAENTQTPWQRVELWPGLVLARQQRPGQAEKLLILNMDPGQGRWQDELQRWEESPEPIEHRETLLSTGLAFPSLPERPMIFSLSNGAHLHAWAEGWADALNARGGVTMPKLLGQAKPLSLGFRKMVAVAFTAVVVCLCGWHHVTGKQQLQKYQAEISVLEKRKAENDGLTKSLDAANKRKDELTKSNELLAAKVDFCQRHLQRNRERLAQFLHVLASEMPKDLMVSHIDGKAGEPVIHGSSLDSEHSTRLARALAVKLESYGWTVEPPKQTLRSTAAGIGVYDFQLNLHERPTDEPGSGSAASANAPIRRTGPGGEK